MEHALLAPAIVAVLVAAIECLARLSPSLFRRDVELRPVRVDAKHVTSP